MREILFRAKRTDNGKWVEGKDIMHETVQGKLCLANVGEDWVSVEPETFGQYTGLTDKNGKRIFEGDVVRLPELYGKGITVIRFYNGAFQASDGTWTYNIYGLMEVIGNIYDNPEFSKKRSS